MGKSLVPYPLTTESVTDSDQSLVISSQTNGIRTLTLNRPSKLNALSIELIELLSIHLLQIEQDAKVQLLVLRGNGKAFCAGGDVSALSLKAKAGTPESIREGNFFMQRQYQLNHIAASLRKPAIAVWHRIAMGGGIGISVPLDFRIATEHTMIAMPECGIAFFPDVGASFFLNQLRPGIGMYLALTGARVTGYDALVFGLATHYIESSQVDRALMDLEVVSGATTNMSLSQINMILEGHAGKRQETEAQSQLDDISSVFALGSVKEIILKLEAMQSDWATKSLQAIRAGSPTAVLVTFSLLNKSRNLSAEACRALEYTVHTNFMRLPDFVEGVGKKLIQKPPASPQWRPVVIEECTTEYIEGFFIAKDDVLQLREGITDVQRQGRFVRAL